MAWQINIADSKDELGREAAKAGANLIRAALRKQDEATIIVATGASQFEMLSQLTKEPEIDWYRVTAFHLDEYIGLPISHGASFRRYLWERFVSQLPLPLRAFHYIDGDRESAAELARISGLIRPRIVDVAFVGIGENGHLAFNDPPADFQTTEPYLVVNLDEDCRHQQLGEGWFPTLEDVPKQAISMSIRQILASRAVICSVPDARKAEAVRGSVEGPVTPEVPASILREHENCQLFLDRESSSLLTR